MKSIEIIKGLQSYFDLEKLWINKHQLCTYVESAIRNKKNFYYKCSIAEHCFTTDQNWSWQLAFFFSFYLRISFFWSVSQKHPLPSSVKEIIDFYFVVHVCNDNDYYFKVSQNKRGKVCVMWGEWERKSVCERERERVRVGARELISGLEPFFRNSWKSSPFSHPRAPLPPLFPLFVQLDPETWSKLLQICSAWKINGSNWKLERVLDWFKFLLFKIN